MRAEDRLREFDRLAAPDLWPDIRTRVPTGEPPGPRWPRLATIALALAVAAAGLGLVAVAFLGGPGPRPATDPSPTPTRPAITTPSPDIEANHSDPWGAPTALSVTCTDEGIEVLSTEVPAQPDGVHIIVDNPGGARIVHARLKGPPPVGIHDKTLSVGVRQQGLAREIQQWPPGAVELSCHGHGVDERRVRVQVTDPQGLWISDELACDDTVPYDRPSDRTPYADLERTVRENVHGVLPSDDIVRAGYPQDAFPVATLLVVRDGEPLAAIELIHTPDDWFPGPGRICVGSGIMGA